MQISEGLALVEAALRRGRPGPYQLQAAIAAVHAEAATRRKPIGAQIAALYSELAWIDPSPVVLLNRAVAIGMSEGAQSRPGLDRWVRRLGGARPVSSVPRRARRPAAPAGLAPGGCRGLPPRPRPDRQRRRARLSRTPPRRPMTPGPREGSANRSNFGYGGRRTVPAGGPIGPLRRRDRRSL